MSILIRLLGLAILLMTIVLINPASSAETQKAEFTVMQGWLMGEKCLEVGKTPCPLEEYEEIQLVLLTPDEKIYRLKGNGVEAWKLQKAYGQLIGLKGLREGDLIKVTNIVQVTGDKKLTKA
jgi:hypothetical protein